MFDKSVIGLVCCVETQQKLSLVDDETLAAINKDAVEGNLMSRGYIPYNKPLTGALVREDKKFFYPIVDEYSRYDYECAIPFDKYK